MSRNNVARADKELTDKIKEQQVVVFSAALLALHRYYGWTEKQMLSFLDECAGICHECSGDQSLSLIKMLDEEADIELQNGNGQSYREVDFLNSSIRPGMKFTSAKWIYMRKRQLLWVNPQIMACVLLALHRNKGYGFRSCSRVYQQIEGIETEYGYDKDALWNACTDATGINATEYLNNKIGELSDASD